MKKSKKIKKITVEKWKVKDDEYGYSVDPAFLLKLLEYAKSDAKSDEELHSIVSRMGELAHTDDHWCFTMKDWEDVISVLSPTEEVEVKK